MSNRRTFLMQAAVASGVIAAATTQASKATGESTRMQTPAAKMSQSRLPRTDLLVSRIGYGCAHLAPWNKDPLNDETVRGAAEVIHAAYDNGITLFDLADMYAYGKCETVLGQVIRQSPGLRRNIVVQSKCGIWFTEKTRPEDPWRLETRRDYLVNAVEGSLQRLNTDHLDILLLHWPDPLVRPDEVAEAFDKLHREGKVHHFGVSNHTSYQIEILQKSVRQPLVVNQIQLSLAQSRLIAGGVGALWEENINPHMYTSCVETLDYCRLNQIQVQAYSPLRGALFSPKPDDALEVREAAQVLSDMAKAKNASPTAIGLAWLLYHPSGIVPLIGASKPAHVVDNCGANNITLSDAEWYALTIATNKIREPGIT